MKRLGLLAAPVFLAGCAGIIPDARPPVAGPPAARPSVTVPPVVTLPPTNALIAGVAAGPAVAGLGLTHVDAAAALASFRESCPRLTTRGDPSGLTTPDDWRPACTAAATWPASRALEFFPSHFDSVRVGDGAAFATGYYEPEIAGSRTRLPGYNVPVYSLPPDLVRGWPDETPLEQRTGRAPLGRYDARGKFVPYYERGEIEEGALAGRGLEIAWVADPIEFFFLQIQGSGILRAPDGTTMRIGYAGQNGREYVGLGSIMRQRGLIGEGTPYATSMQGIMAYLREHPSEGRALMRENKSWIFFTELKGDGPLGALGVPVRRESSVAADPLFVPLGAPVWLQLDRREANGLWIAQDTGGAIKGANRFDTFWGAGDEARRVAGGMSARGEALVLLPKEAVARLTRR